MPKAIRHTLTWGTVLVLMGCEPELPAFTVGDVREVPSHFPAYVEPADNPLNEAKWELGRHLFFDERFSADGMLSCASCHNPSLAMADSCLLYTSPSPRD